MEIKISENKYIGDNHPCFIVAEIGQNHNGSIENAKKLIDMSSTCQVDAVKFCKRDINSELTKEAYDKPYPCPQSFGESYGKHREFLELNIKQHKELSKYAKSKGLIYFTTVCDKKSLFDFKEINLPIIKVASRDITNIPLIEEIAKLKKLVIISTGLATITDIDIVVQTIRKYHNQLAILNCTSEYPAKYEHIHLNRMKTLRERYKCIVGYSGHTVGIVMPVIAATLGARIVEKHITLGREMKGTDHASSLEFEGLLRVVRDIRNLEKSLGETNLREDLEDYLIPTKNKLMRSIVSTKFISKGTVISEDMICLKSPGDGINWHERNKIIGKVARLDIEEDIQLKEEMIYDSNGK